MLRNSLSLPKSRLLNLTGSMSFIALGMYIILAAQKFEEVGKATPVFIGTGMFFLAILLLAADFFIPNSIPKTKKIEGSLPRRIIFVGLMVVWVFLLPYLGFLISSILAFILISAAVPRKEKWSLSPFYFHAAAGIVTTVGFWLVLTTLLDVPLPEPRIF